MLIVCLVARCPSVLARCWRGTKSCHIDLGLQASSFKLFLIILAIGIPTFSKRADERNGMIVGEVRKTFLEEVTKVCCLGSIVIPNCSSSCLAMWRSCALECVSGVENDCCLREALAVE